jgi:hypothetical protein
MASSRADTEVKIGSTDPDLAAWAASSDPRKAIAIQIAENADAVYPPAEGCRRCRRLLKYCYVQIGRKKCAFCHAQGVAHRDCGAEEDGLTQLEEARGEAEEEEVTLSLISNILNGRLIEMANRPERRAKLARPEQL